MENLHLMAVAEETGIGLVFCPPGAPYAKGIIKSINRMVTRLQELLPAYKGASPANHPKGVESRALLTVADLQDALWTYVLQIYHHTPHKELKNPAHPSQKLSPAQAYQNYLDHGGWIPITTRWDRILSFLPRERRTVQDYINLHNHVYNSPADRDPPAHPARRRGQSRSPHRLLRPFDVTRIFLRHPVTQKWLRIPIWDPMGLAMPPYSQVLANAALEQLLNDPLRLTKSELRQAEAKFQAAWSRGVFEDRREQRAAALKAQRRAQRAFDLELAGDEFRESDTAQLPQLSRRRPPTPTTPTTTASPTRPRTRWDGLVVAIRFQPTIAADWANATPADLPRPEPVLGRVNEQTARVFQRFNVSIPPFRTPELTAVANKLSDTMLFNGHRPFGGRRVLIVNGVAHIGQTTAILAAGAPASAHTTHRSRFTTTAGCGRSRGPTSRRPRRDTAERSHAVCAPFSDCLSSPARPLRHRSTGSPVPPARCNLRSS